jgi:hypothetical protein
MNGIIEIGAAMAALAGGNSDSEITVAQDVFFLIGSAVSQAMAWSDQLTKDQQKDFQANMLTAKNPRYAAAAAADYARYTIDSNEMNKDTGYQNTILQNQKTELRTLGTSMEAVYNVAQSPQQEQQILNRLLLTFASMN